jgi:hypothetical protein
MLPEGQGVEFAFSETLQLHHQLHLVKIFHNTVQGKGLFGTSDCRESLPRAVSDLSLPSLESGVNGFPRNNSSVRQSTRSPTSSAFGHGLNFGLGFDRFR